MTRHLSRADLLWLAHEPAWLSIVDARMFGGLREFALHLEYTEDFGVSAELGERAVAWGFEVAGKVTSFTKTTWAVKGAFSDRRVRWRSDRWRRFWAGWQKFWAPYQEILGS